MRHLREFAAYLAESETAAEAAKMAAYPCIAVDAKTCELVTPAKVVTIGHVNKETGCSMYMRRCMSEYIPMLQASDAWTFLMKNKSLPVKYNLFKGLTPAQYASVPLTDEMFKYYNTYTQSEDPMEDRPEDIKVKDKIKSLYPRKSGVDLSKLQLGDIVGMYYPASKHIVQAFAQAKKKYSKIGNFTFNTHVGFVGAIKDGQPIIFHNVTGKLLATPAKNLISVNPQGMIAWVIGDPEVAKKFIPVSSDKMTPEWFSSFDEVKGKGLSLAPADFNQMLSDDNPDDLGR